MDPVDHLLLRQESDPRRRSTITVVLELDRVPDWDAFVARLSDLVRREPRMRQRMVRPWRDLGAPEWVVQREIDVREHLSRRTVAPPGSIVELIEFVESIADDEIDQTRPLWDMTMLDGMGHGSGALVVRMSHVLTDGLAGMGLLAGLVDGDEQPASARTDGDPAPVGTDGSVRLTPGRLAAERVLGAPARAQSRYLRSYTGAARSAAAMISNPRRRLEQAAQYAQSLARIVLPRSGPPTFADRSAQRRLTYLEVPADALRRAGRSVGCSLNDAYLGGVTGGIRHYHEMTGTLPRQAPFAIPVSTRARSGRRRTEQNAGNRFAAVRFSAPVVVADPAERIRQITAIVRGARAEPALDAMTTLAPALVQLPEPVFGLAGRAQDRLDVQASYVPGPRTPVHLAGARVTSMVAFGPLPGPAVMSVMVTYAGIARIGLTVDAVAMPAVETLRLAMVKGFAEVLALGVEADSTGA